MGMNLDDDVLQAFLEESCEHLSEIENDLLALEREGADADDALVNRIFRAVHTVKGGSGFFGLDKLGELAHVMESLLDRIRQREFTPDQKSINILLSGSDLLNKMVSEPECMDELDVSNVQEKIEAILCGNLSAEEKAEQEEFVEVKLEDGRVVFAINRYDFEHAAKAERGGRNFYLLKYDLIHDVEKKNLTPWDVISELLQFTYFIETKVDLDGVGTLEDEIASSIPFYALVATIIEPDLIKDILSAVPSQICYISEEGVVPEGKCEESEKAVEKISPKNAADKVSEAEAITPVLSEDDIKAIQEGKTIPPSPAPQDAKSGKAAESSNTEDNSSSSRGKSANSGRKSSTVRVDVDLLDQLMSLAGELVLVRNQLVQSCASCDSQEVKNAAQQVDHITTEMQEAVMATRMQRIGLVFSKFNRIVRDLSDNLGKKVELELVGEDVELDKSIIEAIGDPLTHLVRNSLDHGIETPEVRQEKGKPRVGSLMIAARHEAGHVIINIKDDGKGLDTKRIGEKAVSMGIITHDQLENMSEAEINRLILQPGFSTAEKVTDVSGRGVGMDVVNTNLKKLGGTLDIESRANKGTNITIKLPLTLAIIPSLLVVCREERFIIPQANLSQLLRFSGDSRQGVIENVDGSYVIRFRDTLLPLVFLRQVLEPETSIEDCLHTDNALNIAVVSGGNTRYGLVVDGFLDSAEIVVKPLDDHLQNIGVYSGATILGDGAVSLILDIAGIGAEGVVAMEKTEEQCEAEVLSSNAAVSDRQSLLIVQNGIRHFGILLGLVDRIERISAKRIEMIGNRRTIQYRGDSLLLISTDELVQGGDLEEASHYVVVIATIGGNEVGFIFNEIVDTLETDSKVDGETHRQEGVLGSLILDSNTVLLLDLYEVAYALMPDWRSKGQGTAALDFGNEEAGEVKQQGVLILEDSKFFLQQISKMVEGFGYSTYAAEDGIEGLEVLERYHEEIGLVLTDIEMPRMNGVEFTRAVRDDDRYQGLPIVAVTSVAGDEAEKAGMQAGIDRYLIKLDRDEIFKACEDFLVSAVTC